MLEKIIEEFLHKPLYFSSYNKFPPVPVSITFERIMFIAKYLQDPKNRIANLSDILWVSERTVEQDIAKIRGKGDVYNHSTAGKVKVNYEHQPWFEGITNNLNPHNLVWYASYGSNVNKKRFMKYIEKCKDKTPPKDERPLILDHPIYFSNHSPTWNNQGVAFLDLQKKGKAYGKMYLITEQQFMDIHKEEGRSKDWYNEKVELGYENGIPMITFTHTPRHMEDVIPSMAYLDVIKMGIQETYPELSEEDIDLYLMERYLTADMSNMLRYLREQEHGVKISQLCETFHNQKTLVINVIHNLKELGLIKQDGRTVRAGLDWDSDDAIYYTVPDRRRTIDTFI